MNKDEEKKILKAGKIASEVKKYIRNFVKKEMSLLEIAEKIEEKIVELGGKPAFPTNLSINEIAAHYTPSFDDKTKAHGLLKIDLGVSVDGYLSDTAISLDLENSEENRKLIESSEEALKNAISILDKGIELGEIGREIQRTIESKGFLPIVNLTGHSIERYDLHAGISIPNIESDDGFVIEEGLYAIEPFVTNGNGKVVEGPNSGIYQLIGTKNVRNSLSREILNFIIEEYNTLPFCSRWIVKKFGKGALFALKQLENNNNLHQFSQLVEVSEKKVSQAEHTILLSEKKIVTTK
jgi:methionyl aminopeptidase